MQAVPVPHAGKDDPHNECADKFPPNRYLGMDVLVNGVRFDALQVGVRVLWEIKTTPFKVLGAYRSLGHVGLHGGPRPRFSESHEQAFRVLV